MSVSISPGSRFVAIAALLVGEGRFLGGGGTDFRTPLRLCLPWTNSRVKGIWNMKSIHHGIRIQYLKFYLTFFLKNSKIIDSFWDLNLEGDLWTFRDFYLNTAEEILFRKKKKKEFIVFWERLPVLYLDVVPKKVFSSEEPGTLVTHNEIYRLNLEHLQHYVSIGSHVIKLTGPLKKKNIKIKSFQILAKYFSPQIHWQKWKGCNTVLCLSCRFQNIPPTPNPRPFVWSLNAFPYRSVDE